MGLVGDNTMKYDHAVSMSFTFITDDEDPITRANLPALAQAARKRIDAMVAGDDVEFEVYDTIGVEDEEEKE